MRARLPCDGGLVPWAPRRSEHASPPSPRVAQRRDLAGAHPGREPVAPRRPSAPLGSREFAAAAPACHPALGYEPLRGAEVRRAPGHHDPRSGGGREIPAACRSLETSDRGCARAVSDRRVRASGRARAAAVLGLLAPAERKRSCPGADLRPVGDPAAAGARRAVLHADHRGRGHRAWRRRPSGRARRRFRAPRNRARRHLRAALAHPADRAERGAVSARRASLPPSHPTADVLFREAAHRRHPVPLHLPSADPEPPRRRDDRGGAGWHHGGAYARHALRLQHAAGADRDGRAPALCALAARPLPHPLAAHRGHDPGGRGRELDLHRKRAGDTEPQAVQPRERARRAVAEPVCRGRERQRPPRPHENRLQHVERADLRARDRRRGLSRGPAGARKSSHRRDDLRLHELQAAFHRQGGAARREGAGSSHARPSSRAPVRYCADAARTGARSSACLYAPDRGQDRAEASLLPLFRDRSLRP